MPVKYPMEGAPDWYGKHLDELDFEWSPEEKLEIERYCEKIHKNLAEDEMTPMERLKASFEGKPRDRVFTYVKAYIVYGIRALDSAADALKPIDGFRSPKLHLKAMLATMARFKSDHPCFEVITYGEDIWGFHSKMIEYGNPVCIGEPPIKTMADFEGLEMPDVYRDGLYPGYLWTLREARRIFDEYGFTGVVPLWPAICPGQLGGVMLNMMGMSQSMIALRKDPDVVKKCFEIHNQFNIDYAKAVYDVCKNDGFFWCDFLGMIPLKGNEWMVDDRVKVLKAISPMAPVTGAPAVPRGGWLDAMYEGGAYGPGLFEGNLYGHYDDYKMLIDWSRERNLWCECLPPDTTTLNGPISEIEEEVKIRCEYGKEYNKYVQGIGVVDYWTPQSHIDAAVAAAKKYGKY